MNEEMKGNKEMDKNLKWKGKITKKEFEEKLETFVPDIELVFKNKFNEETNEEGKFNKITLYYYQGIHFASWNKGIGWVFNKELRKAGIIEQTEIDIRKAIIQDGEFTHNLISLALRNLSEKLGNYEESNKLIDKYNLTEKYAIHKIIKEME